MAKITSLVIILIVLAVTLAATPAEGQSRWRGNSKAVRSYRSRTTAPRTVRQPSYATRYRSMYSADYYYPKYTGGFHARYYDGIPSIYGTTRMRGTAW